MSCRESEDAVKKSLRKFLQTLKSESSSSSAAAAAVALPADEPFGCDVVEIAAVEDE